MYQYGPDASPIIESSTNQAVVSKASEWSPVYPPTEFISSYRALQFFVNVYYDFANDSLWTSSVGAGFGMARTNLHYSRRLLRKAIAQGYQDVEPPLTVADRPTRAAGTLSLLETTATSTPLGFQVLGGVDYAVDERTSIRINAHWAPLLHGRCPVSTLLRTQPPPSRLRPFSRGLRLCGLPCSVDFSTGRGRLLQWLGMSLSPCCPYHPARGMCLIR